ncbi:hypothetical protein ABXN37_26410, partial [Piscinibacter sakaiensis]
TPAPAPAPTPAPAPAPASASQCFNLALSETQGTVLRSVFNYSGIITGTQTVVATVGGLTSFEGATAREIVATTNGTNTIAGLTTTISTEVKAYNRAAANGEVTNYGAIVSAPVTVAGFTVTSNSKTVYNPPWVDRRNTLSAGQQITQTYTGTTTTTTGGLFGTPGSTTTNTATISDVVRFVGIESVTVPAGTYQACKFENWAPATPADVTTNWIVVGSGALAKTLSVSSGGTQLIEATSLQLNGATLSAGR